MYTYTYAFVSVLHAYSSIDPSRADMHIQRNIHIPETNAHKHTRRMNTPVHRHIGTGTQTHTIQKKTTTQTQKPIQTDILNRKTPRCLCRAARFFCKCATRMYIDESLPSRHAHPEKHTFSETCAHKHTRNMNTQVHRHRHGHIDTHNQKKDDYTDTEANIDIQTVIHREPHDTDIDTDSGRNQHNIRRSR